MQIATVPMRPSSSPIGGEHEVGRRVRGSSAGSRARGRCPGSRRCRTRTATARAGSRWSAATDHGSTQLCTRSWTWENSWYAMAAPDDEHAERRDEVRRALGRDVEHRREHREEQQRRPEVLLAHHHEDRHAPREQQRAEVLRVGDHQAPDATAPGREQLALVDEVRGEEDDEQHLRGLARLEVHRPGAHPEARAVDLAPDSREQRQQQRDHADAAGTCTGSARGCEPGARASG